MNIADEINKAFIASCHGQGTPTEDPEELAKRVRMIAGSLYCAMENFKATNEAYCKLDRETRGVIGMLILCGEPECRDEKDLPSKLRALIDALITVKRHLAEEITRHRETGALLIETQGKLHDLEQDRE